jgi:hypothetical protein
MAIREPKVSETSNLPEPTSGKKRLTKEDLADIELMDQAEREYRLGSGGSIDEVFAAVNRARGEAEPARNRPPDRPNS